jgi:two-component system sensor histidine kinase/response regulator
LAALLRKFVDYHEGDVAQLRRYWSEGKRQEVGRCAHSLKGVAATLGAETVRQCALGLEQASVSSTEIAAHIDAVEAALEPFLAAIRQVLPEAEVKLAVQVDEGRLQAALAELDALLTEDDVRANAAFRNAASLLQAALGENAGILESQISHFEYDQALQTLRRAVAARSGQII